MTKHLTATDMKMATPVVPNTKHRCIIVVPCYNEEQRLDGSTFVAFADENPDIAFLFVDDGSRDGTRDVLARLSAQRPAQLFAMALSHNSGKAEAVRQGLLQASTMQADLVGYWDADLATPLDAIPDFLRVADKFQDVSVIFGSRRPLLGHRIERTFFRRMVSKICSALAYQALRLPISDTQCGAKMFRNSVALRASLGQAFVAGWLFDVELFSRLTKRVKSAQTSFYELPLAEWDEVAGSKVSAKAILRAGVSMLRLIAENRLGLKAKPAAGQAMPIASVISPLGFEQPTLAA